MRKSGARKRRNIFSKVWLTRAWARALSSVWRGPIEAVVNSQRDDALRALHVDQFAGQRARTGWLQRLRGVSPAPHLSGGGEVTNRAAGLIRGDEAAQSYLMISRQTGRFIVVIDSLQPNLQPN